MTKHRAVPMRWCAALLLATACGPADEAAERWTGTIDTLATGRIVVRSPDVGIWSQPIVLEERFRLGTMEGSGPELFGEIGGLALGPGGEVYVLDAQVPEIRIFGADGAHQRSFGRQGQGPGELSSPAGLALDEAGTLWTLNWGNGRYTGFDPATGEVRLEVPRSVRFATFPWPGAFENGTRLVDVGPDAEGRIAILRLDSAFVPSDALPLPEPAAEDRIVFHSGERRVAAVTEPFAPQPAWAPRPRGGVVLGEGAAYRVHRISFAGDTALTFELDRAAAPVTAAERDSALAVFRGLASALQATPERQPDVRSTRPAHGSLFVDDQDRTWVRSIQPADVPPAWDVFGADGVFMGHVVIPDLPAQTRPAIRDGRMAVVTQADGYPAVVVYELVGGPPADPSSDPAAELRSVLQRLVRGPETPSSAEGEHTWFSAATAGVLDSLAVDAAGHATVDFHDLRPLIGNASTSAGSALLMQDLNEAVFSVDGIESVEYRMEGSCDLFWEWLQYECQVVTRQQGEGAPVTVAWEDLSSRETS